jgi:hypothetical protein
MSHDVKMTGGDQEGKSYNIFGDMITAFSETWQEK